MKGAAYSPAAQAVFSLMSGLTTGEKDAMAAFIDSQVASGNWDLLGCYQDYELLTFANARIDWKGNFNGEASLVSGTSQVPKQGLAFTGSQTRGFSTGYNPNSDAKWFNNNAIIGCYVRNNGSTDDQRAIIGGSGGTLIMWQRTVASRLDFLLINNLSKQAGSHPNGFLSNTHYTVTQRVTNTIEPFENTTSLGTATGTAAKTNTSIFVGGRADGGANFLGTIGCYYAGTGVGFDIANFITNRNILIAALAAL